MEESFDTINLEYIATRKASVCGKVIAVVLMVIFVFTPIYELIPQFEPVIESCTYGIVGACGCIVGF